MRMFLQDSNSSARKSRIMKNLVNINSCLDMKKAMVILSAILPVIKMPFRQCLMAVEAAAFFKQQGKTLYDALLDLYERFGYYQEGLESLTLKGKEGAEQIQSILSSFREEPLKEIRGLAVAKYEDYKTSLSTTLASGIEETISLPKSNVIKYFLEDGSWICLRPSGTEPKIKFYFSVTGKSLNESQAKLEGLKQALMEKIDVMVNSFAG